jgi:hypothetical protein
MQFAKGNGLDFDQMIKEMIFNHDLCEESEVVDISVNTLQDDTGKGVI